MRSWSTRCASSRVRATASRLTGSAPARMRNRFSIAVTTAQALVTAVITIVVGVVAAGATITVGAASAGLLALGGVYAPLCNLLEWIDELQSVDTEGVEPLTSVVGARLKTRADVVTLNVTRDEVLANAPEAMAGFFTVPKVVE